MGISMVAKFTTVFLAFPFFIWFALYKFNFSKILIFGLCILIALSLGLYIDFLHYGSFKNTYYQFYIHNLSSSDIGRMKYFGIEPWYYYIIEIIKQLAPLLSLFFLIGIILFWIKNYKHPLTWITFSTLIIFSLIGHKEIRYIFSIYIFAPFFIGYLISFINNNKIRLIIQSIAIFSNIIFLLLTIYFPANSKVGVYHYLFNNYDIKIPTYYVGENPYQVNNMEPFFYTKYLPPIKKFVDEEVNHKKYLILTNEFQDFKISISKKCETVYSTYPLKLINLNNNWKRLKINWRVYECLI